MPQDLRLLVAELDTLSDKQKSFLIATLQYQISLFKKQADETEF